MAKLAKLNPETKRQRLFHRDTFKASDIILTHPMRNSQTALFRLQNRRIIPKFEISNFCFGYKVATSTWFEICISLENKMEFFVKGFSLAKTD